MLSISGFAPTPPSPSVPPERASEKTSPSLLAQLNGSDNREEAWGRLISLYHGFFRRWALRLGVKDGDVPDLVQSVLVKIFLQLEKKKFEHNGRTGAFRCWLRRFLHHEVRAYHRSWFRRRTRPLTVELEDPASQASQQWDTEHDRLVVAAALEKIKAEFPPHYVPVFTLLLGGEKPSVIAEQFHLTTALVYQIKNRVLARLRAEVQGLVDRE